MDDKINPGHYRSHPSGIECIEISKHLSGCLAQAFQYVWRCGQKDNPIQELNKALWFIDAELTLDSYPSIWVSGVNEILKKVIESDESVTKGIIFLNIVKCHNENNVNRLASLETAQLMINALIEGV